jgi:hypothetical protein
MWVRAIAGISIYQIAIVGLFQSDIVSDKVFGVLEQYPPLVVVLVVLVVVYYLQKVQREDIKERRLQHKEDNQETRAWLEKMLEIQRQSLKEIYGSQQAFLTPLLSEMEVKQNRMVENIERLSQQLSVNTATVNEVAKVDSIVSELIARLEQK